jgi:hypothetical protein
LAVLSLVLPDSPDVCAELVVDLEIEHGKQLLALLLKRQKALQRPPL